MDLVKNDLIRAYNDVFKGVGSYSREYHIRHHASSTTSQNGTYAKQSKLKEKLAMLEKDGIFEDVKQPTDWVHNLVIMEKKL